MVQYAYIVYMRVKYGYACNRVQYNINPKTAARLLGGLAVIIIVLLLYLNNLPFSSFYPPNMNLVIHIILVKGNNGTTIFIFLYH